MKHIKNISATPQVAAELTLTVKLGFIADIIDTVAVASAYKDDDPSLPLNGGGDGGGE